MSKRIDSKVKRFPGYVILSDPLTIPQTMAFEDAMSAAQEGARERGDLITIDEKERVNTLSPHYLHDVLAGVIPCIEEWHIEGLQEIVTPDTFPGTPKIASAQLISWLIGEISGLYSEAEQVPNG